ncbi:flagellar hook-associated protein FlgK [Lysinibacillus capsici]|uniref:flagellar hook-associated protein FlgK n=1 Tax=Lysinibacillus capsici TaxID=2115968 RepID=UPI003805D440
MRSTFMGLEASKRGLFTQQTALYTTGHNISNANTLGYSRQRVNMQATPGFPTAGLNSPYYPGHLGTGVEATSIQRIRDEFIDRQYRQETNRLGYWESTVKSISQIEDVMNEPSQYGINQAFTNFWKSMEDITKDPQLMAGRQVLLAEGRTLADSFNYMDRQLKKVQGNIGNEIKVTTDVVNSLLKQIAHINKQIEEVEPNGNVPNDLYDARDLLVDELNKKLPVSIQREKSGGLANDVAEGTITITYEPSDGSPPITLVNGREYATLAAVDRNGNRIDGEEDDPTTGSFAEFLEFRISDIGEPPTDPMVGPSTISFGQLHKEGGGFRALIEAYGHSYNNGTGQGLYSEMIANLDKLANEFITEFNAIHRAGFGLNDTVGNRDFFSGTTARDFKIVITKPEEVAASDTAGESGNNKNMLKLAELQSKTNANLGQATFQNFYRGITGDLAVKGKEAETNFKNSQALHLQIANNRAAMSSVSLDEEMTNMITFQQAYNANARMITVVDETLDKIINGMGRVGL